MLPNDKTMEKKKIREGYTELRKPWMSGKN